ncbi:UNVERIFIED_ORG: hypothetical protein B2H95_00795 [Clostridium botulinum]|nr:type II restriction endonuclease [Clostridium botulinum]
MKIFFDTVAIKTLSKVEVNYWSSNQHEFNGVQSLQRLFGCKYSKLNTCFVYVGNDTSDMVIDTGYITWYDARENHPTRTEYRLYYTENRVVYKAKENDLLLVGITDGKVKVFIIKYGSNSYRNCIDQLRIKGNIDKFMITDNITL